jgi:hypothetical protein
MVRYLLRNHTILIIRREISSEFIFLSDQSDIKYQIFSYSLSYMLLTFHNTKKIPINWFLSHKKDQCDSQVDVWSIFLTFGQVVERPYDILWIESLFVNARLIFWAYYFNQLTFYNPNHAFIKLVLTFCKFLRE